MATSADGILTATYDPTRAAVMLVVDGGMWPSPVTFITVTRTPVGQPTVTVRGLEMYRTAGGWYIGSDGEMPLDTDVTYGVTGYDDDGEEVRVGRTNEAPDPRLTATTMTLQGATVVDTRPATGGPDGGSFFRRTMTTANTSSPMTMSLSGTGTSAIPVTAGEQKTGSWYARKDPGGGPTTRLTWAWYDAAGALLSTTTGTNQTPGAAWGLFTQTNAAPASAAFVEPRLQWSGTALVGQVLELAQAQIEDGAAATEYFDGSYPGAEWTGTPNASASFLHVPTEATVSTTGAEWGIWLKAPGRVDLTVHIPLATHDGQPSATQGGSYSVIGGSEVHAWSGIAADRTTIQLRTLTTAQEAALYRLLSLYRVVMIQTGQPLELGTGSEWWFVTSATPTNVAQVRSDVYAPRLHTLQIVRSPVPAGVGLVSTGATYSDVSAAYATYTALQAGEPTYADLMTPGV